MKNSNLSIALYPNYYGMGYVISDSPKDLVNYGMAKIRPFTNDKYKQRLRKFIQRYNPSIILLRGYECHDKRISKRVVKVIQSFEREAHALNLSVHKYSRDQIKEVFNEFGSSTKYGISKIITSWYPELKPRMPDLRKNTMTEHYQMGVFDSFALMLTHHYLEA